jgi:hypothetical protein
VHGDGQPPPALLAAMARAEPSEATLQAAAVEATVQPRRARRLAGAPVPAAPGSTEPRKWVVRQLQRALYYAVGLLTLGWAFGLY